MSNKGHENITLSNPIFWGESIELYSLLMG